MPGNALILAFVAVGTLWNKGDLEVERIGLGCLLSHFVFDGPPPSASFVAESQNFVGGRLGSNLTYGKPSTQNVECWAATLNILNRIRRQF